MGFRTKLVNTRLFIHALAVLHNLARTINDPCPPDDPQHAAGDAGDDDDEDGEGEEEGQQQQQQQQPQAANATAARVQGRHSPNIVVRFKYTIYTTIVLRPKRDSTIRTKIRQKYYNSLNCSLNPPTPIVIRFSSNFGFSLSCCTFVVRIYNLNVDPSEQTKIPEQICSIFVVRIGESQNRSTDFLTTAD
jgi:hypothetical protein